MKVCEIHSNCALIPVITRFSEVHCEPVPSVTFEVHRAQWYECQDMILEAGDDLNYDGPLMGY